MEEVLKENPYFVNTGNNNEYSINLIEPDSTADYKILKISPDPECHYEITIIDPDSGREIPGLSWELGGH